MAVTASLKELKRVNNKLKSLKMKYPEAYEDFAKFFKDNRSVGYKNICKMLMGETTPQKLKDK
ncbi:MAG: hypothetical protein ACQEQC_01805 [Elusimicrobiota bacterium]